MKRVVFCISAVMLAAGTVIAYGGPYSIEGQQIVRLDPSYQTTTPIGGGPHTVTAIEFSADGYLYGVDPDADTLVRIDPTTGSSETVGSLGIDLEWDVVDLDEDSAGQLRMLAMQPSGLYTLDRQTGTAIFVCQPDYPWIPGLASSSGSMWTSSDVTDPPDPGCGLQYISRDGVFGTSLETGTEGWIHTLFSACVGWVCFSSFARVDPATGAVEQLGGYVGPDSLIGLTFDPNDQPAPAIPTLRWPGAVVLALLLTAAGTWMLRRS